MFGFHMIQPTLFHKFTKRLPIMMENFFIIHVHVEVLKDEYENVSIVSINLYVYQALPVVFTERHMLQVTSEASPKKVLRKFNYREFNNDSFRQMAEVKLFPFLFSSARFLY